MHEPEPEHDPSETWEYIGLPFEWRKREPSPRIPERIDPEEIPF